jgi:hypothetical protein
MIKHIENIGAFQNQSGCCLTLRKWRKIIAKRYRVMLIILERTEDKMAGPIFVVELEPGLWMNAGNYSTDSFEKAQHFPSEIQAQSRLDYYRRYYPWRNAKIVRIDE